MIMPERALAYERWAGRRLLGHLRALDAAPDRAVRLFAHGLAALRVWLLRLRGRDSSGVPIWPAWSLDECAAMLDEIEPELAGFLRSVDAEGASGEIHYTNQHGLPYTTAVADALFHVASHGAYHRGQIALVLREAGLTPLNTDYITFVRELAGQPWKP
jgi:uncharacterized damage-inducible protein DinB